MSLMVCKFNLSEWLWFVTVVCMMKYVCNSHPKRRLAATMVTLLRAVDVFVADSFAICGLAFLDALPAPKTAPHPSC